MGFGYRPQIRLCVAIVSLSLLSGLVSRWVTADPNHVVLAARTVGSSATKVGVPA
jgi:hypothetical protein